jgi:alkylated DNA repair dioxygenase AlkB
MQLSLLGRGDPCVDALFMRAERIELGQGAWLEHTRGWIEGHDTLLHALERAVRWQSERRRMWDRVVDVPRLLARVPDDGDGHPILASMAASLERRYAPARFDAITLALYRSGSDSVAWHRDREHRDRLRSFVCVASLGGERRFMVRPFGGGASLGVSIAGGDLLVMGGTAQRTFEHCIPKTKHADPRLAIMFRHTRPIDASYHRPPR